MKDIRQSFFSGIKHTAIAQYSNVFINLFIGAVLARLLTPEEFGTVAMVTVFVTFFSLFSDMGISVGIVQFRNLTSDNLSSIFNLSLIIGATLGIGFWFSAHLIAGFYNSDKFIKIVQALSIVLLFHAAAMPALGILRRDQKFKQIGLSTVSISLITGIVGIILAYIGFSYWALIIRSILSAVFLFVIQSILAKIRIKAVWDFKGLFAMLKYSLYNFLFQFVNFFSRNLDNILIGKYLGPEQLGFYEKSYRVMKMPLDNFTTIIAAVTHPVLSNHGNDTLIKTHLKLIKMLALIGIPISVLLFHFRSEIIIVLFGNQWGPSAEPFKWLALSVWIQMILSSTGGIFQASGKTNYYFLAGILSAIIMVIAIVLGIISDSIEKVGFFLLFAFVINFFQGFYILYKYVLGLSLFEMFKIVTKPFLIGVIAFFSIYMIDRLIQHYWLGVIIKGLTFFTVYLISYYMTGYFKFLIGLIPGKILRNG